MNQKNLQTPKKSLPEIFELHIDRLSYNGGRGVGRFNGMVVFVEGTAPGDEVKVRLTKENPTFCEAKLIELVKPSSARRDAPCPVFLKCGGCVWQHISYEEQLRQKQGILEHALKNLKIGELHQIVPSKSEWRYRNRIQVHVQNKQIGFFAKGTRDIVPVVDCLIAEKDLVAHFGELAAHSTNHMRRVEIARTVENKVSVEFEKRAPEEALFSQVNTQQNQKMLEIILAAPTRTPKKIADLYAGSGNITFPLAKQFPSAEIFAVELSSASVQIGKKMSVGFSQIKWFAKDVAEFLKRSPEFDLIVLDPPRLGCSKEVTNALCQAQSEELVYVSCNPMTFARDAKALVDEGKFRIEWVQPVDMFPQTEHIELISKFTRAL